MGVGVGVGGGGGGDHLHKQIILTIRYDHIYPYVHNPGITCITRPKWRHNIKRMKVEIVMIGIGGKNGNVTVIFDLFTSIFRFPSKKCGKMQEQWHLCTKPTVPYPYHFN